MDKDLIKEIVTEALEQIKAAKELEELIKKASALDRMINLIEERRKAGFMLCDYTPKRGEEFKVESILRVLTEEKITKSVVTHVRDFNDMEFITLDFFEGKQRAFLGVKLEFMEGFNQGDELKIENYGNHGINSPVKGGKIDFAEEIYDGIYRCLYKVVITDLKFS